MKFLIIQNDGKSEMKIIDCKPKIQEKAVKSKFYVNSL